MAGTDNLRPVQYSGRSPEEVKAINRKGGIASGKVRAAKKSMKELVKIALETPLPESTTKSLIKKNPALAESDIDLRLSMVLGQVDSAQKGNTSAFKELILLADESTIDKKEFKIPAEKIASSFVDINRSITDLDAREYVFKGGRGSTKSSFVSMKILELIMNDEKMHALAVRRVADTLKQSVYAQLIWAIGELGLAEEFKCAVSPMEITRKSTGQKIYFRGADDESKIKSIKASFGYIGVLWFEELDSFKGDEQIRSITQSVIRGGDNAYIFKSFNPPITQSNWANKYILLQKDNRLVHHSTYQTVPKKWLGIPFFDEAEWIKDINERAYKHEYMGEAVGTGGNVFENVKEQTITDDMIGRFDRVLNGIDWGYVDPFAYVRMHYDKARRTLYIFDEAKAHKTGNIKTGEMVKKKLKSLDEKVVCDSSEPKSVADYKSYGIRAFGAEKGPGSVNYSFKWLQSLTAIIIDSRRCPHSYTEFVDYEYERTKDGEIISGYPDKNDHFLSAVRYATEEIWKRKEYRE